MRPARRRGRNFDRGEAGLLVVDLSKIVKDWSGDANLSGVEDVDAAVDGDFWAVVADVSRRGSKAMHFIVVLVGLASRAVLLAAE